MPIVTIHLLEGRSQDKKKRLVKDVTEVICRDLELDKEQVRIILSEMPRHHYAVGGITMDKKV